MLRGTASMYEAFLMLRMTHSRRVAQKSCAKNYLSWTTIHGLGEVDNIIQSARP